MAQFLPQLCSAWGLASAHLVAWTQGCYSCLPECHCHGTPTDRGMYPGLSSWTPSCPCSFPLIFHWAVHHFIDLWAPSVDLGHSRSLGCVGCNHPSCLWLHLSCTFVDGAVCLTERFLILLSWVLYVSPVMICASWCLWRKLLLPRDSQEFALLRPAAH